MSVADTSMPGEDPGSLPGEQRNSEHRPADDMEVKINPGLESDPSVPEDDDPEIEKTEQQPT